MEMANFGLLFSHSTKTYCQSGLKLAQLTGFRIQYLHLLQVIKSLKRALQPSVTNVEVDFQLATSSFEVIPSPAKIPTIFKGDKVVIYATFKSKDGSNVPGLAGTATLKGQISDQPIEHSVSFELPAQPLADEKEGDSPTGFETPVVHHLAAKSLLSDWSNGLGWSATALTHERKEGMIKLSVDSSVISEHTAFVAYDVDQKLPIQGAMKVWDLTASAAYGGSRKRKRHMNMCQMMGGGFQQQIIQKQCQSINQKGALMRNVVMMRRGRGCHIPFHRTQVGMCPYFPQPSAGAHMRGIEVFHRQSTSQSYSRSEDINNVSTSHDGHTRRHPFFSGDSYASSFSNSFGALGGGSATGYPINLGRTTVTENKTPSNVDQLTLLISLQQAAGFWALRPLADKVIKKQGASMEPPQGVSEEVWATVLALECAVLGKGTNGN